MDNYWFTAAAFAALRTHLPDAQFSDATGLVSGTPTSAGNAVIFVRVTDAAGLKTQRGWNVAINYTKSKKECS